MRLKFPRIGATDAHIVTKYLSAPWKERRCEKLPNFLVAAKAMGINQDRRILVWTQKLLEIIVLGRFHFYITPQKAPVTSG